MKKIIMFIFLFITTDVYSINNVKYVNAQSGLRLRENPDIESKIILIIPFSGQVVVIEEKKEIVNFENINGKWTKVKYKNIEGWVFGGFLGELIKS